MTCLPDQESTSPEARLLSNRPKREILVRFCLSNQRGLDTLLWELQMHNANISIFLNSNGLEPSTGLGNARHRYFILFCNNENVSLLRHLPLLLLCTYACKITSNMSTSIASIWHATTYGNANAYLILLLNANDNGCGSELNRQRGCWNGVFSNLSNPPKPYLL